ncbi:MAG: protein kinase [Verrucomicrobiota bacterium]
MDGTSSPRETGIVIDRCAEVVCSRCKKSIDVSKETPFASLPCPHCGEPTTVPARLGEYVLLSRLGAGGMGAVFHGYDPVLKRPVAVKLMQGSVASDPDFVVQFLREGRAMAALNHPHVVQIHTCAEAHGQPYIVMEFVPEGCLLDLIEAQGALNERFVMDVGFGVAEGLAAAAQIGMVHGDVKPQNILFDREGKPKVVDFGLARFKGEQPKPGEIWGTPYYIAPEVARGGRPDVRADIYSLGATLFHALTGQPPFQAETAVKTVVARLEAPAPGVRSVRPELHQNTADTVARMLEADRTKRYPNYTSLLSDLEQVRQALAVKEPVKREAHKPADHSHRPARLIAAVLVAALLAGAVLVLRRVRTPPKEETPPLPPGMTIVQRGAPAPTPSPPAPATTPGVPPPAAPPSTAAGFGADGVARITSGAGSGGDSFIQAMSPSEGRVTQNFGGERVVWVKAGKDSAVHLARKGYLRFDLAGVDRNKIASASVQITVAERTGNAANGQYELLLWGVAEDHGTDAWFEGGNRPNPDLKPEINWLNAPANDTAGGARMLPQGAGVLARTSVPANPAPGQTITFSDTPDGKIAGFLRRDTDSLVTFAVTADETSPQRLGWKFASRENPHLPPPTLVLKQ